MAVIKDSKDGEQTELFIDGEFVAGWKKFEMTELQCGIVCNMIEEAVEYGERKKSAALRKLLGVR